jgi:hypothetical protein
MEQRNGRVDRHGQRAREVQVYHFVGKGYRREAQFHRRPFDLEGDLEFLMRAALKVDTIREDLGKVGPVIASQVEEAMLGHPAELNTDLAEREAGAVRSLLRLERQLREQIEALHAQLQETRRELKLSPENIEHVVRVGLEVADQPPLQEVPGQPGVFIMPAFRASWALCNEGLPHPHTGEIRPITFDHDLAKGRDDVVLVHLNHRLVQMCLRLLRAEVWSVESRRRLHRVSARLMRRGAWAEPVVVAHGRIVVLGGDNQRLHEEVISAGGVLRHGRFARLTLGELREALGAALDRPAPEHVRERLIETWPVHAPPLLTSLEVRMRERTDSLQRQLEERARKETADIRAVLTELRGSILQELKQPAVQQLELFKDAERDQLERNVEALRLRAERIPEEIEREVEVIAARYANLNPRLFPVAVEYLVPEGL